MRLRVSLAIFGLLVVAPMMTGLLSVWWIALCKLVPVPGFLFAMIAIPPLDLFSLYCLPVQKLFDRVCINDKLLGDLIAFGLPCDAQAWVAVGAFYALVTILLAQAAVPIVLRLQKRRAGASAAP